MATVLYKVIEDFYLGIPAEIPGEPAPKLSKGEYIEVIDDRKVIYDGTVHKAQPTITGAIDKGWIVPVPDPSSGDLETNPPGRGDYVRSALQLTQAKLSNEGSIDTNYEDISDKDVEE